MFISAFTFGEIIHSNLEDLLFYAPGIWNILYCRKDKIAWLNPQPAEEDIPKLYENYPTHSSDFEPPTPNYSLFNLLKSKLKKIILSLTFGYDDILKWLPKGKLLDVGCGNGQFLSVMRQNGYSVYGVEPDHESAKIAKNKFGIPVVVGSIFDANFESSYFDAITMNHVIEHLINPIEVLQKCKRLLKMGGRILIFTPNIESLGHRIFGNSWRGLEPPRHLYIFSKNSLSRIVERANFRIERIRTVCRDAKAIWIESRRLKIKNELNSRLQIEGKIFQFTERMLRIFSDDLGEEIMLAATPNL